MRGSLLGGAVILALCLCASASAAGLPSVKSGQRPGPPLLYAAPPAAPQLQNAAPFKAAPLLVSGTDAYRGGEYLYQDYLFDDHGADTVPTGSITDDPSSASKTGGDVKYPTDPKYGNNAADIVEFRVKPTADAVYYRITLGTVKADDATVVGIGIDTDRSGGPPVAWPRGAGVTSPGLDRFITAWGTGGEVTSLPAGATTKLPDGAVTIDQARNQMTIRVPRSILDPGTSTWRYVAGAGLWGGDAWKTAKPGDPTAEDPGSGSALPAAGVFNLAFRFDEPQLKVNQPPYTTFPGVGNWFEDKQANVLGQGTTGDFHADVDFSKLAAASDEPIHRSRGHEQARIFASALGVPEGVKSTFPEYGGQLQPYMLTVPPCYRPGKPTGLTFALHSLSATYTQYAVFSPNQLRELGDDRCSFVATPLGYGQDGWYSDQAEGDVFEVWADVARNFSLDPGNVALSGYSMGGYGTYKLGVEYPDLFGKAFTTVGPPGRGIWVPPAPPSDGADTNTNPLLENVRWVPYMNWAEATDELVPYAGVRAQQSAFDSAGLRSALWTFTPGEHYTLAIEDAWSAARDFLRNTRVERDPWRVDYAFFPSADRPKLGLVHDHAYWVSGLRARDTTGDGANSPALGDIGARSLAFGEGDPELRRGSSAGAGQAGPPALTAVESTDWGKVPATSPRNELDLDLRNIGAATIDGRRARLDPSQPLTVKVTSDGAGSARINLPFARGTRASKAVRVDRRGATITTTQGTRSYRIVPPVACVDRRRLAVRLDPPHGSRFVDARAYVNGKRVQRRRGKRIGRLVLRRLPRGVFRLRIVAITGAGERTVTARRYRGCG
jgi:hypothetical protein